MSKIMYVHHICVQACGTQKRALDPRELELQMNVTHHMGAGEWTQVLCKNSNH